MKKEADEKAVGTLQRKGLDLKDFADLFPLLKAESNDPKTLNLLSTYPLTEDSIEYAKDVVRHQKGIRDNEKALYGTIFVILS